MCLFSPPCPVCFWDMVCMLWGTCRAVLIDVQQMGFFWCWYWCKKPWFVAFANFHGVNLLTITYFRILKSYWLVVLRYNSSLDLVGAGPAAKFGGQPADWWPHPCGSRDHLRHPLCFLAIHTGTHALGLTLVSQGPCPVWSPGILSCTHSSSLPPATSCRKGKALGHSELCWRIEHWTDDYYCGTNFTRKQWGFSDSNFL